MPVDGTAPAPPPAIALPDGRVAITADLLSDWLGFAAMQHRALEVMQTELTRTSHHVERATLDLSDRFRRLAGQMPEPSEQIAAIVTGLQFQDLATQRIAAINDSLAVLNAGLEALEIRIRAQIPPEGSAMAPREGPREWLNPLFDRFTLGEMRERFVRKLLLEGTALDENGALDVDAGRGDSSDGDIELF